MNTKIFLLLTYMVFYIIGIIIMVIKGRCLAFYMMLTQIIMTVGISYGADIDKAKAVIEKVINKEELILQNIPIKVYVESLDSSAVTIGLRAFVKNEDYFPAKWALTENIKKALDAEGVEIPFDQLDVHIKNE